jgi:hypothetical protein
VVVSEFSGRLALERDCLVLRIPQRSQTFLPIWPEGSRFDGRKVTLAIPGRAPILLPLTRDVRIGGSGRPWHEVPATLGLSEIASRCPFTPFFVVEVG